MLPSHPPPVRAHHIADVGHRLAAELRRPRHAPARHDKLALAVGPAPHDRRELIGKDRWKQRQIARPIMLHSEEIADGGLALGQTVKVAHLAPISSGTARAQSERRGSKMSPPFSPRPKTAPPQSLTQKSPSQSKLGLGAPRPLPAGSNVAPYIW